MLTNHYFVVITFLKNTQIKLGFLIPVFDYNLITYNQEKVLKNYLKLLTANVNLRLTEYQRIKKLY